jgi:hypothetical protein
VAEIEADRRYRDRLLLRAPRIGLLSREILELEEFRTPLAEFVAKCAHDRLERLLNSGYGTPAYGTGFWRLSYYSDWRAAEQICARFGKDYTFEKVRSEYLTARDTLGVYGGKLAKLRQEVQLGETLECDHDNCLSQIERLPETHLDRLRAQLASYLGDLDLVAIGDRLAVDPGIDLLAKRYHGLRKQTAYLRDSGQALRNTAVHPLLQSLQSLDREIVKYQRPRMANALVARDQLGRLKRLEERGARYRQTASRFQQTQTVICSFHDYQHGRLDDDYLWWDLMTYSYTQRHHQPHRAYGQFIPEVGQFRSEHPDYHFAGPARSEFADDADAQAAAAGLLAEDDAISSSDPS